MGREDFAAEIEYRRRPYLGRGLFAGGIVAVLLAVVFAGSASIAGALGLGTAGARELAGALAGIGLAAALVGALAVVPTDRAGWYRGLVGTLIALCGVGAFLFAYPGRWYGDGADLTLSVVAVYSLGVVTTASYLFAAVTDLARRVGRAEALAAAVPVGDAPDVRESETGKTDENRTTGTTDATEPTGTTGTTEPIVASDDRDQGEVLYERTDDPEPTGTTARADTTGTPSERPTIDRIEPLDDFSWPDSGSAIDPIDRFETTSGTTADAWASSSSGTADHDRGRDRDRTPIAAGHNGAGSLATPSVDGRSPEADSPASPGSTKSTDAPESADERVPNTRSPPERSETSADGGVDTIGFGSSVDRYCGNCTHFRYVQTERGLSPYCGYHDEVMDDMEACLEWTSNA